VSPLESVLVVDNEDLHAADADALNLLPVFRRMEMSTFAGVERRTYAELCSNLTERMYAIVAGIEEVEGGLVVADSRWPNEVHGKLILPIMLKPMLEGLELTPLFFLSLALHHRFQGS
jgi:hypothetical protein